MTDSRTAPVLEQEAKTTLSLEPLWRVVVLDDLVHLKDYVVLVLRRVFGFDDTRARRHTQECHERGRTVVWLGAREKAEAYVFSLQEWHLSAILERDETH